MTKPTYRARAARRRLIAADMRRAAADPPAPDDTEDALARVEALSRAARAMWLGLLAYLAFVLLTLFSVRDVDFFTAERSIDLPLVNIAIPTAIFFLAAPVLGAALHVYLHLSLLKLWDALAALPAQDAESRPIGDRIFPWLIGDWALRRRPDRAEATTPRPMDWFADWVTMALVWLAGPAALTAFWWRSMPAHDEGLTLFIALTLLVAGIASWRSYRRAKDRMAQREGDTPAPRRRGAYAAAALLLAVVSWARTEGGLDHYGHRLYDAIEAWRGAPVFAAETDADGESIDPATVRARWIARHWLTLDDLSRHDDEGRVVWTPLAPIDLRDADLARQPADWVSRETARSAFRADWCRERGLPAAACHAPRREGFGGDENAFAAEQAVYEAARQGWCAETARAPSACGTALAALDGRFEAEWAERREGYLATLSKPGMRARDLRRADAVGAFLVGLDLSLVRMAGADLSGARLEGADLRFARLEGADLIGARMEGANLIGARLEGANLRGARMAGADLSVARLEGARLLGARLERADLGGARLEGANLRVARLEGATLREARLEGANLREARMEGANLIGARMEGADLGGARMEGADLRFARLEGATLRLAQVQSADWAGATIGASPAQSADLTGGRNLTQRQLDEGPVIGDEATVLPRDAETGAQLTVWSCWESLPAAIEQLLDRYGLTEDDARAVGWLCSDTTPRIRTGTPAE